MLWDIISVRCGFHLSPGFCGVFGVLWNCSSQRSVVRDLSAGEQAQSGTAKGYRNPGGFAYQLCPGIQKSGGFASNQHLLFLIVMW